jgi:5-hydroxyisourate hydrolase-like protein (transthyretin family)
VCLVKDRTIYAFAQQVGFTLHELNYHEGIEYFKKIIKKCLKQPFLQHVVSDFVVNEKNRNNVNPFVKISNQCGGMTQSQAP